MILTFIEHFLNSLPIIQQMRILVKHISVSSNLICTFSAYVTSEKIEPVPRVKLNSLHELLEVSTVPIVETLFKETFLLNFLFFSEAEWFFKTWEVITLVEFAI